MHSISENAPAVGRDFYCAQAGCQVCQDALVRAHIGLIHIILQRVQRGGVPYAELVQEGRLALWRAVLRFDPTRGVRFASYGGVAVERALWAAVRRARHAAQPHEVDPAALPEMCEPWAKMSQQADVRAALCVVVRQLPDRLAQLIIALYGLDGRPPYTQAALGRAWGLSRERIRQLHQLALELLRHPGLSQPLYQACARDNRTAYRLALQRNRAGQRRRR